MKKLLVTVVALFSVLAVNIGQAMAACPCQAAIPVYKAECPTCMPQWKPCCDPCATGYACPCQPKCDCEPACPIVCDECAKPKCDCCCKKRSFFDKLLGRNKCCPKCCH